MLNHPFVKLDPNNLSAEDEELLGPLVDFIGTWGNDPYTDQNPPQGWNLISIPGLESPPKIKGLTDRGFIFETIPYYETITFTPIVVTANFGIFDNNNQQIQKIGALLYDQRVKSAGLIGLRHDYPAEDKKSLERYFTEKNFNNGNHIHAELGMLLNISNYNKEGELQFARMGNIPHGNTILCLGSGNANQTGKPGIDSIIEKEKLVPFAEDKDKEISLLAYGANTIFPNGGPSDIPFPFYPYMNPKIPHTVLIEANKEKEIISHSHISLSTANGTGGILNIPFLGNNSIEKPTMDTTQMDVDYWLSKVSTANGEEKILQYFQNIRIVFPFTGDEENLRIVWPHVGLNTLKLARNNI